MKLSISLITAALTAIAGSVVAAPCPHARALENVNSLSERDVDVYSRGPGLAPLEREDDLFIRTKSEAAKARNSAAKADKVTHSGAADARRKAGKKWIEAAEAARKAASNARKTGEKAQEASTKAHVIADHVAEEARMTGDKAKAEEAAGYRHQADGHQESATLYRNEALLHDAKATAHDNKGKSHNTLAASHRDEALRQVDKATAHDKKGESHNTIAANHRDSKPQAPSRSKERAETSRGLAKKSIGQSNKDSERYQQVFDEKEATIAGYDRRLATIAEDGRRHVAMAMLDLAGGGHGPGPTHGRIG